MLDGMAKLSRPRHRTMTRKPRFRSKRDWYDYVMFALALAVLVVGVLGLLR
jgi:hypothetical protein